MRQKHSTPRKVKKDKESRTVDEKGIKDVFPNVPDEQLTAAQNFYVIGISADLAHTQPGMPGRHTTQAIWRYLDEKLRNSYNIDANERQILAKQQLKKSFERLVLKLEIQLSKIEQVLESHYKWWQDENVKLLKLKKLKTPKPFQIDVKTENLRLRVMNTLAELRDHLATTDYALSIHEADESEIIKHLESKTEKLIGTVDKKVAKKRNE